MPFQPGYSPLEQRMEHLEREFVRLGQSGQNANQQAQGAGGSGAVVIQATGTLTGPIPEDQVIFDATGGHDHSAGNSTAVPMSGDLTGTNQAAVVVGIEGVPLSGAPGAGNDHQFIRYDLGLGQFVYAGAVMLAPDAVDRNLIVPTADANHGLVTKNFSATLTGANPYEHRLSTGTVVTYVNPAGIVAGVTGFFGDAVPAVLAEIKTLLGNNGQLAVSGQTAGFCEVNIFGETSGTQFNDLFVFGGVNRSAPANSQAQAAFQFGSDGHLDNTGTLLDYQFTLADYNAPGYVLAIEGNGNSRINIGGGSPFAYDGQLLIIPHQTTTPILTLRPQALQTANQQEWQNSGGTAQMAVAANGRDWILDTTTGTKIGTVASQKLAVFGATPLVQQSSTTDLKDAWCNFGWQVNGGATPLNLDGGVFTTTGDGNALGRTTFTGAVAAPEVATSANTTLDGSHFSIFEDTTGGNKTVTLPTAVGIAGRIYCVKNVGTGANTLTIATTSAQTIDGAAGASTSTPQACLIVQSDGANWQTLSSN